MVKSYALIVTVCGAAAAKLPAAGCVKMTVQVPVERSVTTPPGDVTEQVVGVVEVYVIGPPEVEVAPIETGDPGAAFAGTVGGTVIASAPGVMIKLCVTGAAAA